MNARCLCFLLLSFSIQVRAAVNLGMNSGPSSEREQAGYSATQAEFDFSEKLRVGQERYRERMQLKESLLGTMSRKAEGREAEMALVRNKPAPIAQEAAPEIPFATQSAFAAIGMAMVIILEVIRRRKNAEPQ